MITGMYQTTLGVHNHRSQRTRLYNIHDTFQNIESGTRFTQTIPLAKCFPIESVFNASEKLSWVT